MWQQAGRAGRQQQRSLAVLVAGDDALDQWFMSHPRELFTRRPEPVIVNPANPFVLDPHLACASYELPLTPGDDGYWEDELEDGIRRLVLGDALRLREGRAVFAGMERPSSKVGLRTGSSGEFSIVDEEGALIGTVDAARAFSSVHPGAIYLHQGQHHRVERLDLDDRAAWVKAVDPQETTQTRSSTSVAIVDTERTASVGASTLALGVVEVTEQVTGYRRISLLDGETIGDVDLDLPPTCLTTRAFWYTVEPSVLALAGVRARAVPGTLHAAEHAGIGMLPLFTICDRWDVGGVSTALQADTMRPTIVIYDGYPGGAGIAELGFAAGRTHLEATLEAIRSCPCEAGMPVVRAVAEVRQPQRPARQGRRGGASCRRCSGRAEPAAGGGRDDEPDGQPPSEERRAAAGSRGRRSRRRARSGRRRTASAKASPIGDGSDSGRSAMAPGSARLTVSVDMATASPRRACSAASCSICSRTGRAGAAPRSSRRSSSPWSSAAGSPPPGCGGCGGGRRGR